MQKKALSTAEKLHQSGRLLRVEQSSMKIWKFSFRDRGEVTDTKISVSSRSFNGQYCSCGRSKTGNLCDHVLSAMHWFYLRRVDKENTQKNDLRGFESLSKKLLDHVDGHDLRYFVEKEIAKNSELRRKILFLALPAIESKHFDNKYRVVFAELADAQVKFKSAQKIYQVFFLLTRELQMLISRLHESRDWTQIALAAQAGLEQCISLRPQVLSLPQQRIDEIENAFIGELIYIFEKDVAPSLRNQCFQNMAQYCFENYSHLSLSGLKSIIVHFPLKTHGINKYGSRLTKLLSIESGSAHYHHALTFYLIHCPDDHLSVVSRINIDKLKPLYRHPKEPEINQ